MLYQFWVYNPDATPAWSQVQAYSTVATCSWTPASAGMYLLSVTAHDGVTGAEVNDLLWYAVSGPALTAVSLIPSLASPQYAGTAITLTAEATGGTNVLYQFWVYYPAATPAWSQLQAYSTSATCVWTPATAGAYLLSTSAYDIPTGTEVNQMLWYTVTAGQVNFAGYWPMAVGDQWYYSNGSGTPKAQMVARASRTRQPTGDPGGRTLRQHRGRFRLLLE